MTHAEELIAAALRRRLDEVERQLPAGAAPAEQAPESDDPEETLRVVMVRSLPLEELLVQLSAIRSHACGPDLRYLDAWNNAYEALRPDPDERLLATYAEILRAHTS